LKSKISVCSSGNHKIEVSLKLEDDDDQSQDTCLDVDPFYVDLVVAKEPTLVRITGLEVIYYRRIETT
jgi:hypothetical protein